MKTIAIIEGSKNFNEYLLKILEISGVELKFFVKHSIKKEDYYDYIVVNSNDNIKGISLNSKYCFINMDLIGNKNNNISVCGNIITYGLGSKNTVTVSSIENKNSFVYCLQRDVKHKELGMIESAELPVKMSFSNDDELYASMVAITISLIEEQFISKSNKGRKNYILN